MVYLEKVFGFYKNVKKYSADTITSLPRNNKSDELAVLFDESGGVYRFIPNEPKLYRSRMAVEFLRSRYFSELEALGAFPKHEIGEEYVFNGSHGCLYEVENLQPFLYDWELCPLQKLDSILLSLKIENTLDQSGVFKYYDSDLTNIVNIGRPVCLDVGSISGAKNRSNLQKNILAALLRHPSPFCPEFLLKLSNPNITHGGSFARLLELIKEHYCSLLLQSKQKILNGKLDGSINKVDSDFLHVENNDEGFVWVGNACIEDELASVLIRFKFILVSSDDMANIIYDFLDQRSRSIVINISRSLSDQSARLGLLKQYESQLKLRFSKFSLLKRFEKCEIGYVYLFFKSDLDDFFSVYHFMEVSNVRKVFFVVPGTSVCDEIIMRLKSRFFRSLKFCSFDFSGCALFSLEV